MSYAIITLGGKQYRVSEGEKLLVDRLREDEGATVTPRVLLAGGDGDAELDPKGVTVTARVVRHVLGDKILVGKYKRRTGYRRHVGYRSRLTQIEIEAIGKKAARAKAEKAEQVDAAPAAEAKPAAKPKPTARPTATPKAEPAAKPKAKAEPAEKKAPARKPATRKKTES